MTKTGNELYNLQFLKGGEDPATDLIALTTTDPGAMALNGSS